jgi:hypothetical protein
MYLIGIIYNLQHREWAAVKTVAIGTVRAPVPERGEWVVHSAELS